MDGHCVTAGVHGGSRRASDGHQLRWDWVTSPLLQQHPIARLRSAPTLAPNPRHLLRQCLLARRRHPQASILGRLRRRKLPHIPANNSSTKIALPFSISPLNQELIFYNCTGAPVKTVREGHVETRCRNNTFVRAGEHYDEKSSSGSYFLESCGATFVPVLGGYGEVNASRYEELIRDGFLLTWHTSSWPTSPPSEG
ncbi:hypothetical protein EJB05_31724, partial [Eragrostis curvula]